MTLSYKYSSILILFILGCQKKLTPTQMEWSSSDSLDQNKISEIAQIKNNNKLSLISTVRLGHYTIQNYVQNHNDANVENTYLREVLKSNKPQKIQTNYYPSLQDNNFLVQEKKIESLNPNVFLKTIKSLNQKLQAVEIFNPRWQISNQNGQLTFVFTLEYFKTDSFYQVQFNNNGHIISEKKVGSSFNEIKALIFPSGPKHSDLSIVLLQLTSFSPKFTNSMIQVSSEYPSNYTSSDDLLKTDPQDLQFDPLQAYFYVNKALQWYEKKWGFKLPFKLDVKTHVGYPEKTNSAFYYQGNIRLGTGDDEYYKKIAQDPSIVIHETTHALIDALIGLPFQGEGGSINEGLCDFITALILENPKMAETAYIKGPYKRILTTKIGLNEKNGGLYHDSLIVSGILWELSRTLTNSETEWLLTEVLAELKPLSDLNDFRHILIQLKNHSKLDAKSELIQKIFFERQFLNATPLLLEVSK